MRKGFAIVLFIVLSLSFGFVATSCKRQDFRTKVDLSVKYEDGVVDGKAVYKFVNNTNNVLNTVWFNLYPNAYNGQNKVVEEIDKTDAYYCGESFGSIKINECTYGGMPANFSFCDNGLTLSVSTSEIFPNDEVQISITFETTLPKANLRLGITENTVNLADFYPVLCKMDDNGFVATGYAPFGDPYYSDVADYSVKLTVPSVFVAAASGYPEKTTVDGNCTEYEYSLRGGRSFAFVLSDKFNVASLKSRKTDIYYYYVNADVDIIGERLKEVQKCFDFYSSAFGEYPYSVYSLVETCFFCGGMEFSGLSFISENESDETKLKAAFHETAHQWWGTTVGNDQVNEAYIDEGLAEYSVYLYLLKNGKKEEAIAMANEIKAAYKSFFDILSMLNGSKDTSMEKPLSEFKNKNEYVAVAYKKSFLMFYELEKTVGSDKMISFMKKFFSTGAYENVGFEELVKAFGYKEFFQSFKSGDVIV